MARIFNKPVASPFAYAGIIISFFLISQIAIGFAIGPAVVFHQYFGVSGLVLFFLVLFVAIVSFIVWLSLQFVRRTYYASLNGIQLFFLGIMVLCPVITALLLSGPFAPETREFTEIIVNWGRN